MTFFLKMYKNYNRNQKLNRQGKIEKRQKHILKETKI